MPAADLPSRESWRALTPRDAVVFLSAVRAPWWVAGGWALDLFLGKATRAHTDLDIGILRRDAATVLPALAGWEFFEAKDGGFTQLSAGGAPRKEINSLWCKRPRAVQWEFELMLDASDGQFWVFRRDPRISRPLASVIRRNPEGIAYLAPEIQLLYKARAMRAQDQADFRHVVPHLAPDARIWLRGSLMRTEPEHEWLSRL
jgi:Aminoglycoside-2''-adenylyltransferase